MRHYQTLTHFFFFVNSFPAIFTIDTFGRRNLLLLTCASRPCSPFCLYVVCLTDSCL